jgi:hypothetical protein
MVWIIKAVSLVWLKDKAVNLVWLKELKLLTSYGLNN